MGGRKSKGLVAGLTHTRAYSCKSYIAYPPVPACQRSNSPSFSFHVASSYLDRWEIFVQIKYGRTISLAATPEDTIGKLKDKIQVKANLLKHKVCLLYEEKSLEDSRTLAHYNIREGPTLSLTGSVQVYVQLTPGWKTVPVEVQLSDTIADIKARIRTIEAAWG